VSYAARLYAVDLGALSSRIGSGDADLALQLRRRYASLLADYDLDFDDHLAAGAPSVADSLRRWLVEGIATDEPHGWSAGYAFELLCDALGRPLRVSGLDRLRGTFLDEVDEALTKHNAPPEARFDRLLYRPPLPMPRPADFPAIGHWPAHVTAAFREWYADLDLDLVQDDDIATLIEALADASAQVRSGEVLVSVYS